MYFGPNELNPMVPNKVKEFAATIMQYTLHFNNLLKTVGNSFSSSKTVVSLAELDCASPGASPVVSDSSSLFELGMVRGKKKTNRDTTRAIVPNMRKPSHQAPIQRGSLGVIVVGFKLTGIFPNCPPRIRAINGPKIPNEVEIAKYKPVLDLSDELSRYTVPREDLGDLATPWMT